MLAAIPLSKISRDGISKGDIFPLSLRGHHTSTWFSELRAIFF